jgi:phosphatidylglycerol:prolipoprotein diacylglycerol transferase
MFTIKTINGIYLIFFFLSLIINSIFWSIFLKKEKYQISVILSILFYENFGFIIGAKIFSYFANYPQYDSILSAGVSAYGALIGGLLMVYIFCLQFNFPILKFLTLSIVLMPLIYAIGKLGCFFGGCCYGMEWDGIISVKYINSIEAPNGVKLFPVQLVESIVNLGIFLWLVKIKKSDTEKIGWTLILCSLVKFSLDFLRAGRVNILSINQWTSIIMFVIGIIIIFSIAKKGREIL